jgi:hypothetical protein
MIQCTTKGIFGMNVGAINPGTKGTFMQYFVTTAGLTVLTVWIIVAFQSRHMFPVNVPFWKRLGWPFFLFYYMYEESKKEKQQKFSRQLGTAHNPPVYYGVLRQVDPGYSPRRKLIFGSNRSPPQH